MEKSGVTVSISSVWRVLLSYKNIKRRKLKNKPMLTTKRKAECLSLCKRKSVLEKKKNGEKYYYQVK